MGRRGRSLDKKGSIMPKGEQGLTIAFSADSTELICRITLAGFPTIPLSTDIENDGVRKLAAQTLQKAIEKFAPQIAPPAPKIAPPSETLKFEPEEPSKSTDKKTDKKTRKKTRKKTAKKNVKKTAKKTSKKDDKTGKE